MTTIPRLPSHKTGDEDRGPFLLGLIGSPIKHSASPSMHEAAAAALGYRAHYQLVELEGADQTQLRVLLDGVRHLGFAGVNVTFPYKEAVIPLIDELADGAAQVGAVNTIVVKQGRLIGHNTDVTGFARAVRGLVAGSKGPVAVIGAGGIGKAAAIAMAELGAREVRVFDLNRERAQALASMTGLRGRSRVFDDIAVALKNCAGVVNATPVGMWPNRSSPVPRDLLRPDLWVADAVYSPLWTPLLLAARDAGCEVMTGRTLAINQAVDAFALFTGLAAPEAVMANAFDSVIASRQSIVGDPEESPRKKGIG